MLEPRRLATSAAAHRMATTLDESVGGTVGYRMKLDTKVGPKTRIEVVTEGILGRLLQQDPALSEYAIVLFDEFHERSLQADTGLALCLEAQRLFRPDLRLLVMSATLDCGPVSDLLGHAPVIACEGKMFPVETRYLDRPLSGHLDVAVVQSIRRSLAQDQGSLLVFLPGMAEIRRVERTLLDLTWSRTSSSRRSMATCRRGAGSRDRPHSTGRKKYRAGHLHSRNQLNDRRDSIVIDAGLLRVPRFDPRSGLQGWRPFASPRILPSNAVVEPVGSNRASVLDSGLLRSTNRWLPAAHRRCSMLIWRRCCLNWPSGAQPIQPSCPGSLPRRLELWPRREHCSPTSVHSMPKDRSPLMGTRWPSFRSIPASRTCC